MTLYPRFKPILFSTMMFLSVAAVYLPQSALAKTGFIKGDYETTAFHGSNDCSLLTISEFEAEEDFIKASWVYTNEADPKGTFYISSTEDGITAKFDGGFIYGSEGSVSTSGNDLHVNLAVHHFLGDCTMTFILEDVVDVAPTSTRFVPGKADITNRRSKGFCQDMNIGTFRTDKFGVIAVWFVPSGLGAIEIIESNGELTGNIIGPVILGIKDKITQVNKDLHAEFDISSREGNCKLSFDVKNVF